MEPKVCPLCDEPLLEDEDIVKYHDDYVHLECAENEAERKEMLEETPYIDPWLRPRGDY